MPTMRVRRAKRMSVQMGAQRVWTMRRRAEGALSRLFVSLLSLHTMAESP